MRKSFLGTPKRSDGFEPACIIGIIENSNTTMYRTDLNACFWDEN